MEFIDLEAQQRRIQDRLSANIKKVLDHGKYIMGPEVVELETKLGRFVEAKHAVACASGTDALLLALMAHGVGPGDAIFTTPFTFIATAEVIALLGATPVFVDIDPGTFNMDPERLQTAISALISKDPTTHPLPASVRGEPPLRPKGIIAVDLFGLPADYDAIGAIAAHHGLFVIEDGAQSFGAEYKSRKACALGDIACTSFFPAKPLGCYGDGGMCFTNDDSLAVILKSLRVHGKGTDKYDNVRIGINGRLDTLQAAILLAKFEIFPEEVERRNRVAAYYSTNIPEVAGKHIVVPEVPAGYLSVWAQYSLLAADADSRAALQKGLKEKGVPTAVYYPKPLHLQTAFLPLKYDAGAFPICEAYSLKIFSLPMHPYLEPHEQDAIIAALRN